MILISYAGFMLLSMTVALIDWRRGWLMAVVCGVLQDLWQEGCDRGDDPTGGSANAPGQRG
jgi:hypothetical protein